MNNFKLYAQYAGASYCNPVAGRPVYCKGDICPAGNKSNATIYSVFQYVHVKAARSLRVLTLSLLTTVKVALKPTFWDL